MLPVQALAYNEKSETKHALRRQFLRVDGNVLAIGTSQRYDAVRFAGDVGKKQL